MRCYAEGDAHDFPVEDETGAYCPDHGVTLLWRGDPITVVDLTEGAGADLGGPAAGPYGVVCRSASVSGLPATHALCRRPDCACPCHASAAALREAG
ncbi:hypothetical protein [Streptomyces sp. ADI98-10]|uniref:hypothetical protein n=1 Tax=Streptomyces sp. ADI98-10 TaxID=1522763 RepID=UPI000F54ECD2|nr:hypothetical protein [Streptomyces sp. ADI98-10]RPK94386.1 hypothetical protein EES46_01800 [Streptomyces sp. ADI98-10]